MKTHKRLTALSVLMIILMATLLVSPTMAQQRDKDGDGIPDESDNCPDVPGPAANRGCPVIIVPPPTLPTDTDGDGLPDSDDQCPTVAGPRENRGCPEAPSDPNPNPNPNPNPDPNNPSETNPQPSDNDGDGIPNASDECPDVVGTAAHNGCPPPPALPPFQPPLLSNDACLVTPSGNYNARVRREAQLDAEHIGNLLPGVIYNAMGILETAEGQWINLAGNFEHLDYEATVGLDGYVFWDVVNSSDCPRIEIASADDFAVVLPQLCHMTVGYDSPTWSDSPEVPSYTYASFWFAAAPGEAIPAGTKAWGVIYVAPYIILPDAANVFAVATDPATMQAAIDSDYAGAFNWPTQAGGIISGGTILYRLTGAAGGSCGPIVNPMPDLPLANPTNNDDGVVFVPPINQFACTISTPFNWIFAFNAAPNEIIPVGTSAQAVISGDLENFGDASQWVAELRTLGDVEVEYMTYGAIGDADYRSFPRTGGTCGVIGDDSIATARLLVFPLPPQADVDGRDFLVWQRNLGASDDDDLDLYLVNAPGGDNSSPPPEFPWQVNWMLVSGDEDGTGGSDTVEICYYAELYEEGVYNEVCVEIEIPEGCVLEQPEAGVYIIRCDEDDVVQVNPLFGDAPMINLQGTQNQPEPYLQWKLTNVQITSYSTSGSSSDALPASEQPQTIEYCVYEEVHEAGVFEEVCYEIEIPEGCVLTSMEAGVFTMDCEDDTVQVNPILDNLPSSIQSEQPDPLHTQEAVNILDSILNDLCTGDYLIWWDLDENGEPLAGSVDGGCVEWL